MKIGNLPERGVQPQLNKWYFELEVRSCPPHRHHVFMPWVFVAIVRFVEFGEPWMLGGKKEMKKGGWWYWTCPRGIWIEIIH